MTNWLIDELAYAGPEHLDPTFVAGFDRKQGADDIDDIAVLEGYGLGEDSVVVDLGAGTGRFALRAARVCRRVVAVDVSPAMLAYLGERADAEGVTVERAQAGFLSYEHQGEPADVVYSRHALHQLPDLFKTQALVRIAAMLKPGGILRLRDLILDVEPSEVPALAERWLAATATDPSVGYTAEDIAQHFREEYSTFSWLLEPMLERCGFEVLEASNPTGAFGAYTCRKR